MSLRSTRQSPSSGRFGRIALMAGGALIALLVVGYFGGKAWIESYLRSDAFRVFVNRKVGATLRAESEFAPFTFNGLGVYSDGVKARGFEDAMFSEVKIEQLRGELSLRRFFEKVWQIDTIEAQRLTVRLDGTRLARTSAPTPTVEPPRSSSNASSSSWLPNRVELASLLVRELNLEWGDLPSKAGHLRGLQLRATPADGGWNIDGRGGQIVAAGLPELEVGAIALRQRERSLFINSADFTQSGGGSAHVSGEVRADDRIDLQAQLNGIDLAPFLSNDWRLRLHGKLTGEVRIQTPLPVRDAVGVSGSLHVVGGQIDALPVLDEIAVFTRTQQYRRIALTNASGDFERDGKRLAVKNLVAEAQGLIRIEGAFTIADAQIDGTFQVGVTPASLQWLPGSQERVFTEARAGYVWAPMRLTGPVDSPKEDLSRRLIVAAGDAVVDKVESTARDAIKTGREAAKGALDYLMPLLK